MSAKSAFVSRSKASHAEPLIKKTFNVPRERVFDAWTQKEEVAAWFGPEGFTTDVHEFDLRLFQGPTGQDLRAIADTGVAVGAHDVG